MQVIKTSVFLLARDDSLVIVAAHLPLSLRPLLSLELIFVYTVSVSVWTNTSPQTGLTDRSTCGRRFDVFYIDIAIAVKRKRAECHL